MKKFYRSLSLTILLAILIASCDKEKPKNLEIMPISEGNSWTYQKTNYPYSEIDTSTMVIGPEKIINGHRGNLIGNSFLIRSDELGNTIQVGVFSEYDTVFTESLLFKCGITEGESFDYPMIISSSGSNYFEERIVSKTCIKTDTLILTPAGEFKCIVFEESPDNGGNIFKDYMSINTGLIKSERFEEGKLFSSSILIEYLIK